MPKEIPPLQGFRRSLTKELFESLVSLQCEVSEILGYTGTDLPHLERWVRRVYRRPLPEIIQAVRQDGLIEIRKASFDQLKKSATIISQQYNRFLPSAGTDDRSQADEAIRAFTEMLNPTEDAVREVFE